MFIIRKLTFSKNVTFPIIDNLKNPACASKLRRASARNFKVPKDIIGRNMVSLIQFDYYLSKVSGQKSNLEWTLKTFTKKTHIIYTQGQIKDQR